MPAWQPNDSSGSEPKVIAETRDYLRVSTYDADVLPLDSLLVIGDETQVTFGWLSSRAFWIWTQVVRRNIPNATTYTAYVNFPAPKLGRKDRNRLEVAPSLFVAIVHVTFFAVPAVSDVMDSVEIVF